MLDPRSLRTPPGEPHELRINLNTHAARAIAFGR